MAAVEWVQQYPNRVKIHDATAGGLRAVRRER